MAVSRPIALLGLVLLVGCAGERPPVTPEQVTAFPSAAHSHTARPATLPSIDAEILPIALVSDDSGEASLVLADQLGHRRALEGLDADIAAASAPVWSADGQRLAYQALMPDGQAELHVFDVVLGSDSRVAIIGPPSTSDSRATWAPDGERLAYWSTIGRDNEIVIVDTDDSAPVAVAAHPAADRYPAWSPGGDAIAFWSDRSGAGGIWLAPSGPGDASLVAEVGANYAPVAWSPDGERLAVPYHEGGETWRTRLVHRTQRATVELQGEGSTLGAAWSPDGTRLAYWVVNGLFRQLWITSADGSGARPIGPDVAVGGIATVTHVQERWPAPPSWAPDGTRVAAEWPAAEQVEVLIVDVAHGTWVTVTPEGVNDGSPAWRPSPA